MEDVIIQIFGDYAPIILAAMGLCAAIAAFLPAPGESSGPVYRALYAALNTLAVNVGKARNADDVAGQAKKQA